MKKFILLLFIALSGTFIYLKVVSLGNENSSFNRTTRYKLGKYSWVRNALGLHKDGDARAWYLSGPNNTIVVEVVTAANANIDNNALSVFEGQVEQYTGKKVLLFDEEKIQSGKLTEKDLAKVVSEHRHHEVSAYPSLFVVYADDFDRQGDEIGRTYQEYGIVLSDTALKSVTERHPDAMGAFVQSTLLHEFGHQLGLDHNTESNCVMNAEVESSQQKSFYNDAYTPASFCDFELNQLQQIKAQYK